jgi:hypothetical protein
MTSQKKASLTAKRRADLNALAQKVENSYRDFRQAIEAIGPDEEWDGSCLACPKTAGGPVCSSFLGNHNSPHARCQRASCGHSFLSHVGGAGVQ